MTMTWNLDKANNGNVKKIDDEVASVIYDVIVFF